MLATDSIYGLGASIWTRDVRNILTLPETSGRNGLGQLPQPARSHDAVRDISHLDAVGGRELGLEAVCHRSKASRSISSKRRRPLRTDPIAQATAHSCVVASLTMLLIALPPAPGSAGTRQPHPAGRARRESPCP